MRRSYCFLRLGDEPTHSLFYSGTRAVVAVGVAVVLPAGVMLLMLVIVQHLKVIVNCLKTDGCGGMLLKNSAGGIGVVEEKI